MPEIVDQERISALTGLPPDNGPLPNPAAQVRRIAFHEVLVRDPPAQWTANRYQQAVHYEGLPYIAIRAISDWFSGATIQVNVRANGARVQKALTNPGASVRGHDEEFHPAPADDPLVELFEHINPVDTVADFITQWTLQEELTGTVLVWVVRDQEGTPCEMWVLPTALATYLPLSAQYPRGAWQINGFFPGMIGPGTVSSGGIVIPAEDVLHYRKTHPLYRWDGFSPMTGIARQLDTLDGIDMSRKNAMDRGLNVDGVVTIEGATTDECERVQESLRNRYGGAQNSHKIIVAAAEGVKVDKLTIAPEDMEYQAGWEQMVKAVSAGFSVPPAVLGLTEAGSYAAYYAALRQFFSNNLVPRARRIGAFLTKHLARPISKAYSIEVHLPAIGDEDLQERQISSDAQNNAITVNQIEAIRGRKPVEGGDVPPQIYGAMLQAKVQQQFAPPPQPPAMPGGGGAPDGPPADDQPPRGESDKMGQGALGPRMRKAFLAEHLDSLIATLANSKPESVLV